MTNQWVMKNEDRWCRQLNDTIITVSFLACIPSHGDLHAFLEILKDGECKRHVFWMNDYLDKNPEKKGDFQFYLSCVDEILKEDFF